MHLEWYGWLALVAWTVVVGWLALWTGQQIPNGYPVLWKFHPEVKEGHKYIVRALYFECLSSGISTQRCATLQDEFGVGKPFHVFFPPESECNAVVGQLVQPMWQDKDKYILYPIPQGQPA